MGKQQGSAPISEMEEIEKAKLLLTAAKLDATKKELTNPLVKNVFGGTGGTSDAASYSYDNIAGGHFNKAAKKGNWSQYHIPEDMSYKAFQEQSTKELILDTLAGGSKLAVAGFLDMAGSWDLNEISNVASNSAMSEAGNWLQKAADSFQDSAEENKIYQDGDNMWTSAYWANQGQQLGYSIGIVGEMLAEQALLAVLTGGSGNAAALASKARFLKPLVTQGLMGVSGGIRESYMNARETQESVYNKYINEGFSEDLAKAKADEAAHVSFKTEAGSLMVLNTLQNLTLFGGLSKVKAFQKGAGPKLQTGFSSFGEQLLEKAIPSSKLGRRTMQYGVIPSVTEGLEEGIQSASGQFGEWYVGDRKKEFDPFNVELRDSVIGGALGGIILGAGSKAMSKFNDHLYNKDFNKQYTKFIEESKQRTANTFLQKEEIKKRHKEAQENLKKNRTKENQEILNKVSQEVKEAQYNTHLATAINSLQHDYIKGDGTIAFDAHVGQMQAQLDAVKNNDITKLKEFGLVDANGKEKFEGSFKTILETFEGNIKDSQYIKQSLENNLENVTSDFNSAFDITRKEYINSKHIEGISDLETDLKKAYSLDTYVSQLSSDGRTKFILENELHALEQVDKDTTTKELSKEDKERMVELKSEIEGLNYSSKDKKIVPNINKQNYVNAEVSLLSLGQAIDLNNVELTSLKDENKIKEKIRKRNKGMLDTATTPEEVEAVKEEAEAKGVSDEEWAARVAEREAEIKKSNTISEMDMEGDIISKPIEVYTKPVEKTQEAEPDSMAIFSELMSSGKLSSSQGYDDAKGQLFSRRGKQIENVTEEHIEKAKNFVDKKSQQLGKDVTIEDIVIDSIKRNGYKETEAVFNGIVNAMELAGKDITNSEKIYDKFFEEDLQVLEFLNTDNVNEATIASEKEARIKTELKDDFGLNSRPAVPSNVVNSQDDTRTNKSTPKVAFYFQTYERDGIAFTTTSTELQGDNHFVLDPDFVKTGDNLIIEVIEDDSTPITSYSGDGKKTVTTWGEYKKGVEVGSNAYLNKIPMGIYKEVDNEGKLEKVLIGNVHDATWYVPSNMSGSNGKIEQQRTADEGFAKTVEIRKSVLDNGGKQKIKVSQRQFGTIDNIAKSNKPTPIKLSDATGDNMLTTVRRLPDNSVQLETRPGQPLGVKLINNINDGRNKFQTGGIADIRHVYTEADGTKMYMAFKVLEKRSYHPKGLPANLQEDLNPSIYNSVKYAALANIVLNNTTNIALLEEIEKEFGFTVTDAKEVKDNIYKGLKKDITTSIKPYAELFLKVSGNNIILDNKSKVDLKYLQDNFNVGLFKALFGDKGTVLGASFNTSYKMINSDVMSESEIPLFDEQGKVSETLKGYNSVVNNFVYSTVRSHEIKTQDGGTKWVTDIQPTIQYHVENKGNTTQSSAQKAIDETLQEDKVKGELGLDEKVVSQLTPAQLALIESLNNTIDNDDTYSSRRNITKEETDSLLQEVTSGKVDELTDLEFRDLVSSLKHQMLASIDFNEKISIGDIKTMLNTIVEDTLNPIIDNYKTNVESFNKIPSLEKYAKELQKRVDKLEGTVAQKDKISGNKGILLKELNKLFGLNLEDVREDEFSSDNNFQKSFLEKDIKLSYSNKLRMAFFGVKELRANTSQEVTNDLTGLPKYHSPDYVNLLLEEVATEIPSDWDVLIQKLQYRYEQSSKGDTKPVYNQISEKIQKFPENLKNELLYKLISDRFTAHKVLLSKQKIKGTKKESYIIQVIDENSSKENIKLKNEIRYNFEFNSPLTMVNELNNSRILNLEQATKYKTAFGIHRKKGTFSKGYTAEAAETLKATFKAIGINLSDNTIKEYLEKNDPFNKSSGILHFVDTNLGVLIARAKNKELVVTDADNNLFDTANKALNNLVNTEIALNGTNISKSIRVAGKTLQGRIQSTLAYSTLKELVAENSELHSNLSKVSFTSKNLLLTQLAKNPQLKEILSLSFSSPESYKVNGKDSYSDTGFDKLSDADGIISSIGLYTNQRGNAKINNHNDIRLGLDFRVGQLPFMTLSDKGRMVYMKSIMVNAANDQINLEGENVKLAEPILDLLFEQVFESEYNRIKDAYTNEDPNIKSFSEGSKIFTFIPAFNIMKVDDVNIHDILKERISKGQPLPSLDFFRPNAMKILSAYISSEVNQKLDSTGKGIIKDVNIYTDEGTLENIDTEYLSKFEGSPLEKGRKLFAEHAVNNLLHQVNTYQIFLGDMAYYTKMRGVIDENGFVNSEVITEKYVEIAETIGQVVDKRSALLIAPGFVLANANSRKNNNNRYLQLQILDVNSTSEILEQLVKASKDSITAEEAKAFEVVKDKNSSKEAILEAYKVLQENNKALKDYFDMEGTDAQEYRTWKSHMDILFRQGNLSVEDETILKEVYTKLSEGRFDEVTQEETSVVMQPLKPVYTGMVPVKNKAGEVVSMRPVYIKSSSFPLLPQLTKNLKIDNLRKNLEALEAREGMTVAASYQTANKIGANKTMLTTEDLYNLPFKTTRKTREDGTEEVVEGLEDVIRDNKSLLDSASLLLETKNFKIQQENPDKTAKYLEKHEDNYISMGSQFWKVILGNGINSMKDKIFPNKFSADLLKEVGIEEGGLLSGEDLDAINNHIFSNFSDTKLDLLYSRLGLSDRIPFSQMSKARKKEVLTNVVDILEEEVSTRNYPEYLTESLNLLTDDNGNVSLESPIFLDANANKFESLLLSLVANTTIFHKLPGLGHISSSSEGFERVTNLTEISEKDRQGITWLGKPTGRLKSTVLEDDTITESEIIIKSHYRRTVEDADGNKTTELVNLSSDTYSRPVYEDGKMVGRELIPEMLDEELKSQFSFRIPTSSHQSGVILKVVGFLPPESGDMLLVPAEHTVQLGEDYDIDKRYIYKSNYVFEGNTIKKLEYSNKEEDFEGLDKSETSKLKVKMYENAMIDIYKSVFQSTSKTVQQKIFKPLSVGVAKETSFLMDKKLNSVKNPLFSTLSDVYQRDLLKAGSDGKGGIGIHSNAVTLEAQMQRLSQNDKIELLHEVWEKDEDGIPQPILYPSIETMGSKEKGTYLESSSKLGASKGFKSLDGLRDVSDQHGENQNVSTDNINEQIMAKRNENKYTIGVFALMATRGFDLSRDSVVKNGNKPMHIPSLFMNQPIIREYVKLKSQQDSISGEFVADKDSDVLLSLMYKYGYSSKKEFPTMTNFMEESEYREGSKEMSGQALYDSLDERASMKKPLMQMAVLQKFAKFKAEAAAVNEVQQLLSLSTGGLGVSYFETLQRINTLDRLPGEINSSVSNAYKLIGDYKLSAEEVGILPDESTPSSKDLEKDGFTKIGKFHWKPKTTEGKMLIDSLKASQNLMDIFFPYKEKAIVSTIKTIFEQGGSDPNIKSRSVLEQKYEIMSELKGFLNTYENSQFFEGDVNEERRRLFMDTADNVSLAKIVKDIQDRKLPIASNPFITNLSPKVKAITEPSLLLYLSSDNTSLDSYTEYDGFGRLLLDDKTNLGEYNGEIMTPKKLAQDLVSYSMLADSQGGATGFDTLVPQKYLQVIGYKRANNINFESFKNAEIMQKIFTQQYLQHKPERATILSSSTIDMEFLIAEDSATQDKIIKEVNKSKEGKKINVNSILKELRSFKYDGVPAGIKYVSIRNPDIKNSDNKYNLYKFNEETLFFEQIPTLGTLGLKEYNAKASTQESIIPTLLPKTIGSKSSSSYRYLDKGIGQTQDIPNIESLLPASLGVKGILEVYFNSPNVDAKTKAFISNLLEYGDLSAKIVYTKPINNTLGQYNSNSNEIYIRPDILDVLLSETPNLSEVAPILKEIILEEIIHSMTVKEFKKYVKSENQETGEVTLVENAPLFATKLVSLYEAAKTSLPYNSSDMATYYSKNIYEFMAGMFVAPDYRKALEEANPGIVKKFLEMLHNMLGNIYRGVTGETLSYKDETFNAVYDLLKSRSTKTKMEKVTDTTVKNPMKEFVAKEQTIESSGRPEVISKSYGVVSLETNPSEAETQAMVDVIKPQIAKQAYKENKSSTANDMFMYGLRWTRKANAHKPLVNKSFANKGKATDNPLSRDGYVYDTVDQNGNTLAPLSDLQPIIDKIESSLDIDMSNYDSVIGNIYLPGQRIATHRDTTESMSAREYPVVVYTIGNDSGINVYKNAKNPGAVSFASDIKQSIPTKNGSIYTFGMDGKGRFEAAHDTPTGIKRDVKYPPITLPDGRVVENYTITLTFRRAADLETGMATNPKKSVKEASVKPKVTTVDRYTLADAKANPNKIYVFGDNTDRKGTGGQAQIRPASNAMGIATKIHPTNNADAFMSDSNLEENKKVISSDIQKILDTGKELVLPKDGFGTGLAKLKEKAPQTFAFLEAELLSKFGFTNSSEVTTETKPVNTESKFEYNGIEIDTKFPLGAQQQEALIKAIDYVENPGNSSFFTIEGSAGTGKTTIIGYLEKYFNKKGYGNDFRYLAPTHAATAQLAVTTAELGSTQLPMTLASSFYSFVKNGVEYTGFQKKLDVDGFSTYTLIVDEASMIEDGTLKSFIDTAKKKNIRVIFMGDSNQIPSPDSKSVNSKGQKVLNRAFGDDNSSKLTKVYRQNQSDLLSLLNNIKDENIMSNKITTTNDGTISILDNQEYNQSVVKDFKENPEDVIYIAYTNSAVQSFNKNIKKVLTGTNEVKVGDKIVGYAGKDTKQITKGNIANSVSYIVESIEHVEDNNAMMSIRGKSKLLEDLVSKGIEDITPYGKSIYVQLNSDDSIFVSSVTNEDMEKANSQISKKLDGYYKDLMLLKKQPYSSTKYAKEKDLKDKVIAYLGQFDFGNDYHFNPKNVRLEKIPTLKGVEGSLFSTKKGMDYGYGITAHKSQGMTIDKAYVDFQNIYTSRANQEIVNKKGEVLNTEKNSLYYVAMSRAKNNVTLKDENIDTTETVQESRRRLPEIKKCK